MTYKAILFVPVLVAILTMIGATTGLTKTFAQVTCDPSDPNPPSECNQASQPNSDGSCPDGTGMTSYGSCCPHGTMNVHAYCETQAQNDKNIQQTSQNVCNIIGAVGALTGHWFQTATGWICR
jgi:hypothetical protein